MNHVGAWDEAHQKRVLTVKKPDQRLVTFIESFRKGPHPLVLDVGCGTGFNSQWLTDTGHQTWAFDSSMIAIQRALTRIRTTSIPWYIVADATKHWPYKKETFNAVIDIRSLENLTLDEMRFAWSEVVRVLKPGGRFFSITAAPNRDDALTTAGAVCKLSQTDLTFLADSGFSHTTVHPSPVEENGKIVADWRIEAIKGGG